MSATTQKHRHLQAPLEKWSIREKLALASSVSRSGDQNWASVIRAIKPFCEEGHPAEQISQKNCAQQYAALLDNIETPKRKRGERNEVDTPGLRIVRRLNAERIDELKQIIAQDYKEYKKLKEEIVALNTGTMDDRLEDFLQEMEADDDAGLSSADQMDISVSTPVLNVAEEGTLDQGENIHKDSSSETNISEENTKLITPSKVDVGSRSPLKLTLSSPAKSISTQEHVAKIIKEETEKLLQEQIIKGLRTPEKSPVRSNRSSPIIHMDGKQSPLIASIITISKPVDSQSPDSAMPVTPKVYDIRKSPVLDRLKSPTKDLPPTVHHISPASKSPIRAILVESPLHTGSSFPSSSISESSVLTSPNASRPNPLQLSESLPHIPTDQVSPIKLECASLSNVQGIPTIAEDSTPVKQHQISLGDTLITSAAFTSPSIDANKNTPKKLPSDVKPDLLPMVPTSEKGSNVLRTNNQFWKEPISALRDLDTQLEVTETESAVDEELAVKQEPASPSSSSLSSFVSESSKTKGTKRYRRSKDSKLDDPKIKSEIPMSDLQTDSNISIDDDNGNTLAELTEIPPKTLDGKCSPLPSHLTDSALSSPLSFTDTEEEIKHKTWKKSIMLVWRAAANHKFANVFLHKVTNDIAPGYEDIVHRPMDLREIKKNIDNGTIRTTADFQRDVMLMFTNALMYNDHGHDVYNMAMEMYDDMLRHIEQYASTQVMLGHSEIKSSRPSRRSEPMDKEETRRRMSSEPDGSIKKRKT